jgi:osmotically-inducible protein OsmY
MQPEEDHPVQDNTPAASAARELKAAARDALRMGSQWAHTALHWIDERSTDMNNRNRDQEQRERAERNRDFASGYGSDEGDHGASQQYQSQQHYASRPSGQSSVLGGRQGYQGRDRDIQDNSGAWRQGQRGREGSYPQASASPDDFSQRGDYARGGYESSGYGSSGYGSSGGYQRSQGMQSASAQGRGQGLRQSSGYGAGSESYDDQDFSQDYSQGSSHYGSQGFGAQGSQGVYGPQGFGSQGGIGARGSEYGLGAGYSGSGGYSREGYGASQYGQGSQGSGSEQWRARDVSGQGFGSSSTSYRGLGPKNYTRSDERIREDLNEKLTDAHDIDASGLSVEVNNGVATLTGSVAQRWMKHRAEDLAESCSGVRDVNNQIRVSAQSGQQSTTQRDSLYGGSSSGSASSGSGSARQSDSQSGQTSTTQSASGQSASGQSGTSSATGSSGAGHGGSSSSSTTQTNRPGGSSLS